MDRGTGRVDGVAALSWCATLLLLMIGVDFSLVGVVLGVSVLADDPLVVLTLGCCSVLCLSAAAVGSYFLRYPGYRRGSLRTGNHVARH